MTKPFNERLRDALASGSSAIVASMIGEAQAISAEAANAADEAKTMALDPLLADAEILEARKAAEDASFTMERMAQAVTVLQGKREEFREAEDQAERSKVYAAAVQTRDDTAARLASEFPDLANRLGQLLADVAAADAVIDAANNRLPAGENRIEGVETTARPGFAPHLGQTPLTRLTIPSFDAKAINPTWGSDRASLDGKRSYRPNQIGGANDDVSETEAKALAKAGGQGRMHPSSSSGPVNSSSKAA